MHGYRWKVKGELRLPKQRDAGAPQGYQYPPSDLTQGGGLRETRARLPYFSSATARPLPLGLNLCMMWTWLVGLRESMGSA